MLFTLLVLRAKAAARAERAGSFLPFPRVRSEDKGM